MPILIIISIAIVGLAYISDKRWFNPVILFNGTWLIIYALYQLQLFETYPLDDKTLAILLIQTIAFPFGTFLAYRYRAKYKIKRSSSKRYNNDFSRFELREKVFWVLCAITIVVLIRDEITIISNLIHGSSFHDIMRMANGKITVEITGPVNVFLYLFIVHPITGCISPICATEFFSNSIKKYYYLVANIVVVALSVAHHGGRNAMIIFALSYVLCFAMMGKKIHLSRRVKRIMFLLMLIIAILFVIVSSSRGIEKLGISVYAYIIAAVPLCGIYLSTPAAAIHTFGFFSFRGIFYPLMTVLNFFGIDSPTAYYNAVILKRYMEDNYVRIGEYHATGINSFLPAGAYFFVDWGFIGEFIGVMIYGFVVRMIYERYRRSNDKRGLAILLMFNYGLILSFTSFMFSSYNYAIGLLLVAFLLYKKQRNDQLL